MRLRNYSERCQINAILQKFTRLVLRYAALSWYAMCHDAIAKDAKVSYGVRVKSVPSQHRKTTSSVAYRAIQTFESIGECSALCVILPLSK